MRDWLGLFVCSVVCAASIACGDDGPAESHAPQRSDAAVPSHAGKVGSEDGSGHKSGTAGGGSLTFDAGMATGHHDPAAGEITDAEIGAVFSVLNDVQLRLGNALSKRAVTALARDYARMMLSEYTGNQERQDGIFQRLEINRTEGRVSEQLETEARRLQDAVDAATQDVDLVYMQLQVELQRKMLRLIEDSLAPSAMHHTVQTEVTRIRVQLQHSLSFAMLLVETLTFNPQDAGTER